MKNFLQISLIILFAISCKSTKVDRNNKLDVETVKTESNVNNIQLSQIDLKEKEIIITSANPKEETIITDAKGNSQKFKNVKSITIKNKSEKKQDSIVNQEKEVKETKKDKSEINEKEETVSDAKNFKGMFGYIALISFFILIIFLIIRFRIKPKKDNLV